MKTRTAPPPTIPDTIAAALRQLEISAGGRPIPVMDYQRAIDLEADAVRDLNAPAYTRAPRALRLDDYQEAARRIQQWHDDAPDYYPRHAQQPAVFAEWMINRRPACVWAVLQGLQTRLDSQPAPQPPRVSFTLARES